MTCIGASLAHSVLMVFSSVVHLAITVAESTVRLVDASQALAVDMFQDIVGLVAGRYPTLEQEVILRVLQKQILLQSLLLAARITCIHKNGTEGISNLSPKRSLQRKRIDISSGI